MSHAEYEAAKVLATTSSYTSRTLVMAMMLRGSAQALHSTWKDLYPDVYEELLARQNAAGGYLPAEQVLRHMYFSDNGTLDLQKMRDEAFRAQRGDARNPPQPVIIHFHKYGQACDGFKHEQYLPKEGEIDVTRGYSPEAAIDTQT